MNLHSASASTKADLRKNIFISCHHFPLQEHYNDTVEAIFEKLRLYKHQVISDMLKTNKYYIVYSKK